jgi:DNA-binding transcriptional ArsR family regulator
MGQSSGMIAVAFWVLRSLTAKTRRRGVSRSYLAFLRALATSRLNFNSKIFFCISTINRNIAINMGATKSEIFTEKQNRLAQMLKALAHPARIAILQQLMKTNACICGDLVDELGLAQATISQHLKELKNTGIIQGNIEGTSVCYCINPKVWKQFKKELETFFIAFEPTGDCC